jgi:hypothetical protein
MKNLPSIIEWEAINELRGLATPFRITKPSGWKEIHREAITVLDTEVDERKEIGHISYGIAMNPSLNRFFSIINVETTPISGWGSHQIMTVHQSEHEKYEDALKHLEGLWSSMKFQKAEIKSEIFPAIYNK